MENIPAFYVNLDSRPDRRAHTETQLARIGMQAERVSAVTPVDLTAEDLAKTAGSMSATELACSFSHRKIWRMMQERGLRHALVLEDDALLSKGLPAAVAAAARSDADAVHFECHPIRSALLGPVAYTVDGVAVRRLMSSSLGTCAYYITTDFALSLLSHKSLDTLAVDRVIFGRGGETLYSAGIYQTVPSLAVQLGLVQSSAPAARSDLEPARRKGRPRRKLAQRFARLSFNIGHLLSIIRAFAPSGELLGARQVKLTLADDIKAQI